MRIMTPKDYEISLEEVRDRVGRSLCPTCGKDISISKMKVDRTSYDGVDSVVMTFSCENCGQGTLVHGYLLVTLDIDWDSKKMTLETLDVVEISQIVVFPMLEPDEHTRLIDNLPRRFKEITEEGIKKSYEIRADSVVAV